MGKNKLARWNELGSYDNVIQPLIGDVTTRDHPIKGRWNQDLFKNSNPIVLELGCGRGEYTIGLANSFPSKNYIGIDIKGARMWRGAKTSNEQKLKNAAFLRTRIEFINSFFTENEVDEIWITFPDPHPGTRNSNKRLTSAWYLNAYQKFLKNKGMIHLKTDNRELYEFTHRLLQHNDLETLAATADLYSSGPIHPQGQTIDQGTNNQHASLTGYGDDILSIRTHYENMFLKCGMKITYLAFRLEKEKVISDAITKTRIG